MPRYIPENNYLETNYTPIKSFSKPLCTRCEEYYKVLYDSGITKSPFPPNCEKQIQNKIHLLDPSDFSSMDEWQDTAILLDPIAWAQAEFGWSARFYQEDLLSCTSKYKIYRMGRRTGKCLIKGTLVATPKGPIEIENIKIGDTVYDENGKEIKVLNTFDQGLQNVVDLVNHGNIMGTATMEHPWQIIDRNGNKKVVKTKEISKYDRICRVELNSSLGDIEEKYAYVLGVLSGDGSCRETGLVISSSEEGKVKKVANILNATYRKTSNKNYHWYLPEESKNQITNYSWVDNKYAHEKIADISIIKTWNRNSLLEYMAGLLDTDGSVVYNGKEICISIGMQAKSVIEAFQYGMLALWGVSLKIKIDNRPKYKNGPIYYLSIKNIYHCKRILKELSSYLCVDSKKYKEEYDLLKPNNFNPTGIGITIENPRVEHCYDIHVASNTNLYCLANGLVTHNTEALVIETLYHLTTNKGHTVLIIAPYERQVTRFFDEMEKFINASVSIKGSLKRYTKTPSRMEFNNGSKILGFSSGASSSSGSDKIRGQDANLIVIDEIDTLEDKDIDAVMAILASHEDCKIIAASTPRGWRKKFYNYCTDKNQKFKEFWFISAESPSWTQELEDFFKKGTDLTTYSHEYYADFAELEEGVFKANRLNASLQEYDMAPIEPSVSCDYILGVDWNKTAGTHMVILAKEVDKLRLVKKIIIEESKYTQTEAVEMIKTLNRHWRFKYIFADAGYGSVQCELLRKHTLQEPSSMLDQKLFAIAMNQHLDVIDPISGEPVKRNAKHFLIEQTRKLLEDGYLILPKSEDTDIAVATQQMGLVQQMRNFRVESVSIYGQPRYSQGEDHTLTAYYLAVGGYYWKDGDLKGAPYVKEIASVEISDEAPADVHPSVLERNEDLKKGWRLTRSSNKRASVRNTASRAIDLGSSSKRGGLNNLKRSMDIRSNSTISKKSVSEYRRGQF